jgi:hypothetical protein
MKINRIQTLGKIFYFEYPEQAELTASIFGSKVEPVEITEFQLTKDGCDFDQMSFFVKPIDIYFTVAYNHSLDSQDGRVLYDVTNLVSVQDEDNNNIPLSDLSDENKKTLLSLASSKMVNEEILGDEIRCIHKRRAQG